MTYAEVIAGRCGTPVHGRWCVLNRGHATGCRARPRSGPEAAAALAFAMLAGRDAAGDSPPGGPKALCTREKDPDLFFPNRQDLAGQEEAKAICAQCDLCQQCRRWALAHTVPFGVWGGTTEGERAAARRRKRQAA
jgi:WhiB family redox-sensing transcriptional regulator